MHMNGLWHMAGMEILWSRSSGRIGSRRGPHLASHGFRQHHDQHPAHEYRGTADRSRQLRQVLHGRRGHAATRQLSLQGTDREKIVWKPENDFIFFGSDLLMRHVFINLLKNGLRALGEARQGNIEIRLEVGPSFQPGLLPRHRDRDRRRSATAPVRAVLLRPPRWDQGRHRAHLLPARDRKLRRHAHLPLRTRQIHRVRHQPAPNSIRRRMP